jgi:hypothetical protein
MPRRWHGAAAGENKIVIRRGTYRANRRRQALSPKIAAEAPRKAADEPLPMPAYSGVVPRKWRSRGRPAQPYEVFS